MNEFDLIATYLRPLSGPGSLDLRDDAALLAVPPGGSLVATADALAAGVHFLGNEDAALIARKALRVNLSDLAAMGAQPLAYLLCLMLPHDTTPAWIGRFAEGLAEDQAEFGIALAGGDTIATAGPLTISITALGTTPQGAALTRSGARPGDLLYVSGTLGDAHLGLACVRGELPHDAFLEQRYLLPQPRLALGLALRGIASACMDISDGLAQDGVNFCHSGVGMAKTGIMFHVKHLPLSDAACVHGERAFTAAMTGGDDYELLFAVPPTREAAAHEAAAQAGVPITRIGESVVGAGVRALDEKGREITLQQAGFMHYFS